MGENRKKKKTKAKILEYVDQPCRFCLEDTLDELKYGKMYQIEDITVHYFCVLLSSNIIQRGADCEGILGFLYEDIVKDIRINKKNNCYYCGLKFANIKCMHPNCPIIFHLPCGIRNNSMSLFYDRFCSFCEHHRRYQTIPIEIYESREELLWPRLILKRINPGDCISKTRKKEKGVIKFKSPFSCSICMEEVYPFPSAANFWSPCCKKDKWFHRTCISKLALSAGKHFIKCPLCNNQKDFMDALRTFGFYIPDQDASWELETAAFQDLLFRPKTCYIENCLCPRGKKHNDTKRWKLVICSTCGSQAAHKSCINDKDGLICSRCIPSHPSQSSSNIVMPSIISMVPKTSMTSRIKAVSPRKTDVKLDSGNTCIVRKTRAKSNLENMCMVQKKTPIKSEVNTSVPIFEESYLRNGRKRYRLTRNPANIAFLDILPEDISSNEEKCDKKQKRRSQRISMQSISKTCKVENLLHETKPIVIKSEPIDDDFENEKKILQISNDQFLKSVKQEKIDSEDLNIKNKPINNLHSWLGIQFNTTNIKPVKRKSKKKKTKINFSPNTIEKYFINLNEAKTDKISIKTEPESPNDSFAQNYITVIKNICRN